MVSATARPQLSTAWTTIRLDGRCSKELKFNLPMAPEYTEETYPKVTVPESENGAFEAGCETHGLSSDWMHPPSDSDNATAKIARSERC